MRVEYSAIELVDNLIAAAIAAHASDIHFEPQEDRLRIRFRIDGVLYDRAPVPLASALIIISRIKIMAHLDIAEKRMPQDGKFQVKIGIAHIDIRVSTFPSMYGEKVVIRILDRSRMMITLENLGMPPAMLETFAAILYKCNGFFLVTGPTGSGKTTTLYAALCALNTPDRNIVTLEDPIEYHIAGITQGHIYTDIGFTFACGIRSMLRQDPDVVMVGEIRDTPTAKAAFEASLTGHLVLSTLHTNNAPGALMRLIDMGIEPFLINATLSGILAQRLLRRLCQTCITQVHPTDVEKIILEQLTINQPLIYKSNGCDDCLNLGYKGRIGIFELLIISPQLQALLMERPLFEHLVVQAQQDGMRSLLDDARQKVIEGLISLDELVRVLL